MEKRSGYRRLVRIKNGLGKITVISLECLFGGKEVKRGGGGGGGGSG
jgi:hypothetical protein